MTYRGHVQNGVVVFDGSLALPDGTEVEIAIAPPQPSTEPAQADEETLTDMLLKFAGRAVGLPPDAAEQHDHYLYGTATK